MCIRDRRKVEADVKVSDYPTRDFLLRSKAHANQLSHASSSSKTNKKDDSKYSGRSLKQKWDFPKNPFLDGAIKHYFSRLHVSGLTTK